MKIKNVASIYFIPIYLIYTKQTTKEDALNNNIVRFAYLDLRVFCSDDRMRFSKKIFIIGPMNLNIKIWTFTANR